MLKSIPTKIKNAITTPRIDILLGVALVVVTASVTTFINTKDDDDDCTVRLTTSDFKRMRETGDTLRIRDHNLGDFRVHALES